MVANKPIFIPSDYSSYFLKPSFLFYSSSLVIIHDLKRIDSNLYLALESLKKTPLYPYINCFTLHANSDRTKLVKAISSIFIQNIIALSFDRFKENRYVYFNFPA